ncbi:DinB family protein [Thermoactinomyces mirandus]|uniref:DinB family protein n=1 Tax=Thermoactinomyces mirandus TaxID=2756294 RepID=A0A7W2AR18_9BACL|nr:DinB family protein [Thermoactinomyces mirandus]MBA4602524.1 DinB family protein [Thermoactinomyces mirandus]
MIEEAVNKIRKSIDSIIHISKELTEESIYFKYSADEWSVMEVLCHIAEANFYWLNEIERLNHSPGTEWGRTMQDPERLEAVTQADRKNIVEVLQEIESSREKASSLLASLTEEDLKKTAPSRNPKFGTKPLHFLIEHFLVEHLDTHLKQIQRLKNKLEVSN